MGRPAKPTALRVLEGNREHRPISKREPKPKKGAPRCPEHIRLDAVALRTWRQYVPILLRMKGLLTEADGMVLSSLCLAHSQLLLNLQEVRRLNEQGRSGLAGVIIVAKGGWLAPNQLYLNVQRAMELELKLCRELGLTPSARSRMVIQGEEQAKKRRSGLLDGEWQEQDKCGT
jgi:P27 family predicted phage terminase small subunit